MFHLKGVWDADSSYWPRDTKEHVFLARAVDQVGKALHGEEWTGGEPRTDSRYFELLPPDPKGARDYLQLRAQSYLERNHPQLAQPRTSSPLGFPFTFRFSPEGWETAIKYFNEGYRET